MADVIKKTTTVDVSTGELIFEKSWKSYTAWNDIGYKYRNKYSSVKFFPDNIPDLTPDNLKVFFYITMIMDDNNLLVKKHLKNKIYRNVELKPLTIENIRESIAYRYSQKHFEKIWSDLTPKYIKRIKYEGKMIWAVNPAYANRTNYLPVFLWHNFRDDLDTFLSKQNIEKYKNMYIMENNN